MFTGNDEAFYVPNEYINVPLRVKRSDRVKSTFWSRATTKQKMAKVRLRTMPLEISRRQNQVMELFGRVVFGYILIQAGNI